MKFMVAIWTLTDPERTAEKLSADGVTAVELGPAFMMSETEAGIKAAAHCFKEKGISIFAVHAPLDNKDSLSGLDKDVREKAIDDHRRLLERAALAGAHHVVVHAGTFTEAHEIPEMEKIASGSLEKLLGLAEKLNMKLALENLPAGYPGCNSGNLRRIVEDIASPWLGVCLDTGHAHISGEGVDHAFAVLRDLIIAFHLHDNNGVADQHLQPPYGTIDWSAFGRVLAQMNFTDLICIEALPWRNASWAMELKEVETLFTKGRLHVPFEGKQVALICQECGHYLFGTEQDWFCACMT